MKQDVYRRCDGTFHSRQYRNDDGERYLIRHFNEKGDLFSIVNYKGGVLHGRCIMYSQGKDVPEDVKKGTPAIKHSNTRAQVTWNINGERCTEAEWIKHNQSIMARVLTFVSACYDFLRRLVRAG